MLSNFEEVLGKSIGLAVMQIHTLKKSGGPQEEILTRETMIEGLLAEWDRQLEKLKN